MKVLKGIAIALFLSVILATPTAADKEQEVVVTWTPEWSAGLLNFTMTVVDENQIDFSWTFDGDHDAIMIRAKFDGYPDDIPDKDTEPSDGFLIYYGEDTSFTWYLSDIYDDFEDNLNDLYVKAWAQNIDNTWNTYGFTDMKEAAVVLATLSILGLSFMVVGYWTRRQEVLFAASGTWAVLAFYVFSKSESVSPTEITDIYMALFWLFIMLTVVFSFLPLVLRHRPDLEKDEGIEEEPETESTRLQREYDDIFNQTEIPQLRRRSKSSRIRKKSAIQHWAATGKE